VARVRQVPLTSGLTAEIVDFTDVKFGAETDHFVNQQLH